MDQEEVARTLGLPSMAFQSTQTPPTNTALLPVTVGNPWLLAWVRPRTNRKEVSALLALTDRAVQAVKEIVSSSEETPETGGLRMAAERAGAQANLQLSIVALPAEDDEVIEEHGARPFLDPDAALLLDDKVLDARSNRVRSPSRSQTRAWRNSEVHPAGGRDDLSARRAARTTAEHAANERAACCWPVLAPLLGPYEPPHVRRRRRRLNALRAAEPVNFATIAP
jgi:iron-sulfur cluster assembly protein